jgi:hypothetical protein
MDSRLQRIKPAVGKHVLVLLSGILWIAVGVMLLRFAYHWLMQKGGNGAMVLAAVGFAASLVIHHFGFLRVVDKNLGRILPMRGKTCVFAFQSWKSYLLILVMVGMGIGLRHSPIPKPYLAILYIGIGMALILSSVRYLRVFLKEFGSRETREIP